MKSIVEININGIWHQVAEINHLSNHQATFEYLPIYQFSDNARPVSLNLPINTPRIGVGEDGAPACPSFMFDLVPQGLGRRYLLQNRNMQDGDSMDIPLAQIGAFNPIGHLRLDTAVEFFNQWKHDNPADLAIGFTEEEILNKEEEFANHVWLHAMLTAGTTGVQGAAPKFLLTQDHDGLWFADSALPDDKASKHWLVKMPRGRTLDDIKVLNLEAKFYQVAKACGIRTGGLCYAKNDMLFFERFDRKVINNKTVRLHQESLLSVAGISGFPGNVSLFTLANTITNHATEPAKELSEFIKREVLNRALGNTDNHGRNTAMQITTDGVIQLTPLYDFAPMYLDPEMIPRSCRWVLDKHEFTNINDIIQNLTASNEVKQIVKNAMNEFIPTLHNLEKILQAHDVDVDVIERRKRDIEAAIRSLNG